MDIFSVVLILFCLFIAFFVLYALANDDFVLLRKHITLTKIFDIAILTLVFGLFVARLFYVISHFSPGFLNPLVFLLFPYFPGLSVGGGIIGGMLFLASYCYKEKLALGRIFDIFSLALFSVFPVGIFLQFVISKKEWLSLLLMAAIIVSVFLFTLFLRSFQKGTFKDGSIGLMTLSTFSPLSFLTGFVGKKEYVVFFLSFNDILLMIIFFVSIILFMRQEKFFSKIKNPFLS